MFFYIVIGITNVIILASMMYVYGRAATVQEHRILDVTFTDEQLEDEDIGLIAEHFKKIHGGILLAGFVSQFLLIFLHKYMSLSGWLGLWQRIWAGSSGCTGRCTH